MKLRNVKIDLKFIPEFNGNKKLPPGEQVVIHFQDIPGTVDKANFKGFKFDQFMGTQFVNNDQTLIIKYVSRIDNLTDIDGKEIKDGIELSKVNDTVLESLFEEIRDYLFPKGEDFTEGESSA